MADNSQKPSPLARAFNRLLGFLARRGWVPAYCHELRVRGRKSGRVYATPVNVLEHAGTQWLVGARGHMQWTRNAAAAGEVELTRGRRHARYRVRSTELSERPAILKSYLEAWPGQVQSFFAVKAGAPVEAFAAVAADHPVFELTLLSESSR